jgi:hypothetical protein
VLLLASQDLTGGRAGLGLFLVAVSAWDRGIGLHLADFGVIADIDVDVGANAGVG